LATCHILSISGESFQQALEQYPQVVAVTALKTAEKAADQDMKEMIQRISTRKLIWKRYQYQLLDMHNTEAQKLTDNELITRAMQSWRERSQVLAKSRKQREREQKQYKEMLENWVHKRATAQDIVRQKSLDSLHPEKGDRRPITVGKPAHRKELVKVLEDWPMPRPSPHYRLRVFGVLHENVRRPATGAALLPLLKERQVASGGGKMLTGASPRARTATAPLSGKAGGDHERWWQQDNSPFCGTEPADTTYGEEDCLSDSWQADNPTLWEADNPTLEAFAELEEEDEPDSPALSGRGQVLPKLGVSR